MPVNLEQEADEDMEHMPSLSSEADGLPMHRANSSHAQQLLAHIMGEDLDGDGYERNQVHNDMPAALKELNPYCVTLGLSDLESCVQLEKAAFGPELAATHEKLQYRLSKASELCFGLFTSADPSSPAHKAETAATADPADSFTPTRKRVLLGHVIATKTTNTLIADDDMKVGHHDDAGRTIALHSLAVLPAYQKRNIGKVLLKAYVQRMNESRAADRISILTFDRLVPFYESMGFENKGKGGCQYGGENWVNMTLEFAVLRELESDDDLDDDDDEMADY